MTYLFLKWENNPYKILGSCFIFFLLSNIFLCTPETFCDPEKIKQSLTGGAPVIGEITGGTMASHINGNKLVVSELHPLQVFPVVVIYVKSKGINHSLLY